MGEMDSSRTGTVSSNGASHASALAGISVLLTDEDYKHTLGLLRHLGQRGAQVSVVAGSKSSLVSESRYCREIIPATGRRTEDIIETIYRTVQKKHFDLIIPVGYPKTLALAKCREKLLAHVKLELTDAATVELAADKGKMAELAASVGVSTPKTLVPQNLEEVKENAGKLKFPIVVKPQRESPGRSVAYAKNEQELASLCERFFCNSPSNFDAPLLQEYVPGYGCGFFATYQNGVCKRVFMHRRIREFPASGGASTCAESFYHPELEKAGRRLLDALRWHGVAMAEFRCDSRDGQFKLIEINPKFWGSLDLALAAGADFPGDLCRMARGEELEFTDHYNRNLRFHWPLSVFGELYHLRNRPQSLVNVALDFLNPRVKSNIWFSDFGPNLCELRFLGSILLGQRNGG